VLSACARNPRTVSEGPTCGALHRYCAADGINPPARIERSLHEPLRRLMRVRWHRPLRQSGSQIASTGAIQCWARRQASRNAGFIATVSLRALYVDLVSFGVLRPVRQQPEEAHHRLVALIAIGMFGRPADERRRVPWEDFRLQTHDIAQVAHREELLQAGRIKHGVVSSAYRQQFCRNRAA
jgi:hypothetical protein